MRNLFPSIKLPIKEAFLSAGKWLSDALKTIGETEISTNTLVDKTITGIGATSMELEASRDSIIIEPTLPVIHGKAQRHSFLAVYQICKVSDVKDYLENGNIKYKKLLSTPESFWKIKKACIELGINMYQRFFCLLDECEKLTQDSDYRRKITKPMKDFFQFQGKAFVSATPLDMSDPHFEGFTRIKIKPEFDHKENLKLIITNRFSYSVRLLLLEELKDRPCIFIFLNTTDGITKVIESMGIQEHSKVFCSDISVEKLRKRGFINVESLYQEPLAKYNFLTCRFYSALDINLEMQPDVVMLTDLYEAEYSMIDPFTEAIQIQGRFRKRFEDGKRFGSLTHISNVGVINNIRSEDDVDAELSVYLETYKSLLARYEVEVDHQKKKAILKERDQSTFADFLCEEEEGDREIDYFAIDNYYNTEQVRGYYRNYRTLIDAYEKCGYFNLEVCQPYYVGGDEERFRLQRGKISFTMRCSIIVKIMNDNEGYIDDNYLRLLQETLDFNLIYSAYMEVGKDVFEQNRYQRAEIEKALDKARNDKKKFQPELLEVIRGTFSLHEPKEQKEIQKQLQSIFDRFGIKGKVKINTIEDYFEVSPSYHRRPYTYRLNVWKH